MNPFVLLVPRLWTTEEALAAVRVLRQIIDAIWEVHGEEMVVEIDARPDRWRLDELIDEVEETDDDDIPF
ncbi:MAG: hypothetical protein L0206_24905 [Actinobacteria bacterium]|nr:hypothetical protein [Actinomycetota bacterium]